jgi:chaperone BCS1
MSGYFEVIKVTNMNDLKEGDQFPESDFATMNEKGEFVQMKYHEKQTERKPTIAKPGVYTIIKTQFGLKLEPTSFILNNVMTEFVNTAPILEKADNFFKRVHIYEKHKVFPKRGFLLYGPPGTGKSTAIANIVERYKNDSKYFVLVWHTDVIEAAEVKDFVKHLQYDGPEMMILIAEDIGGVESENRRGSESALLALLDNQELALKLPTLIIATTNYIENFQGNLTNRPGRFDEKIEVSFPNGEARVKLMKHYDSEGIIDEASLAKLASKECDKFTPAQLQEIIIRCDLNELKPLEVINDMIKDIKKYEKNFQETKGSGLGLG